MSQKKKKSNLEINWNISSVLFRHNRRKKPRFLAIFFSIFWITCIVVMDYDDRAGGSCPESSRTDRYSTHRHGYPVYQWVAMRTGYSVNRSASGCNWHLGQFKLRLNLRSFFWTSDHIHLDIGPPSASRQIEDSAGKTQVWGTLAKYF